MYSDPSDAEFLRTIYFQPSQAKPIGSIESLKSFTTGYYSLLSFRLLKYVAFDNSKILTAIKTKLGDLDYFYYSKVVVIFIS